MLRRVASAAALSLGLLVAANATAQDAPEKGSVALNQFDPAPAGDAFFNVPSPYAYGELLEPRAQITFDYAEEPLRLYDDTESANVVGRQVYMNVNVSAAIMDRALVSLMLPVALVQSGDSPVIQGTSAPSPEAAEVGDMRIGLRVRLWGEPETPFQLGVGTYLYVPTGSTPSFVGEGTVRAYPYVSAGGEFMGGVPWVWTAAVGPSVRASDNPSSIRYGAGIAAKVLEEVITVGPEFYASTPFFSRKFRITDREAIDINTSTNLEILLGTRVRVWHFQAGVAGGPGITRAAGTPKFRMAFSLAYNPEPSEADVKDSQDSDDDGVLDRYDGCPFSYGLANPDPKKNGCPVLDDDEDGIPNPQDACPTEYGPATEDPATTGCPPPPLAKRTVPTRRTVSAKPAKGRAPVATWSTGGPDSTGPDSTVATF